MRARIAAYAIGRDYHHGVRKRARIVGDALKRAAGAAATVVRSHVDTGAVLEREWAASGRIGWFGRNTMILNRTGGSYFFLAEILTSAELEPTDAPYVDHCGTCRRCIDICPTGALAQGYRLDARLCISYLTIELKGSIPVELRPKIGNWIFGCDLCQEVCPWNGEWNADADPPDALNPYLPDILSLDDAAFARRFAQSAIKRAHRRGIARNAAVALGNSHNPDAVAPLARALAEDVEAIVRGHAAWALGEIGGASARSALRRSAARETDSDAMLEIRAALDRF
jgi:epoxyqueuosine reductase